LDQAEKSRKLSVGFEWVGGQFIKKKWGKRKKQHRIGGSGVESEYEKPRTTHQWRMGAPT